MILARPADRLDDLRQHLDRADALVELAAAVVRHVDAIDPVIDRDLGVLGGGDALEDHRDLRQLCLIRSMSLPVEPRLVDAGVADPHPAALVALGDVALAPAVAVGVDGQAEGVVAVVDRAADMVVDPGLVAAHVKLKDLEPVAARPRRSFRGRDATPTTGSCRCRIRCVAAATVRAAARLEILQRADRRAQHRDAQFLAEQRAADNRRSTRRATPAGGSRSRRAPAGCAPASSRSPSRRSDSPSCCG